MSRLVLLSPGSPFQAEAALRQAIVSLSQDEEFLADAKKVMRMHPGFEIGEEGIRLYQRVTQTAPEVLDFIRQFIEQVKKMILGHKFSIVLSDRFGKSQSSLTNCLLFKYVSTEI